MENVNVIGDFGTKPVLEFNGENPTGKLEVEILKEGDGQVVEAGDTVVCHYLGQIWGGDIFDTSFDRGQTLSFQIGVGQVIAGWDDGLVGQRVGSRVLLAIPPELGYGPYGVPQAGIGGTDTLVFVTDIVGIL